MLFLRRFLTHFLTTSLLLLAAIGLLAAITWRPDEWPLLLAALAVAAAALTILE